MLGLRNRIGLRLYRLLICTKETQPCPNAVEILTLSYMLAVAVLCKSRAYWTIWCNNISREMFSKLHIPIDLLVFVNGCSISLNYSMSC